MSKEDGIQGAQPAQIFHPEGGKQRQNVQFSCLKFFYSCHRGLIPELLRTVSEVLRAFLRCKI